MTQLDLLAPLEPPPADLERAIGTMRGDTDALLRAAAGVEVWAGPITGWRPLGAFVGPLAGMTIIQGKRLVGGPTFELGAVDLAALRRGKPAEHDDDQDDDGEAGLP